MTPAAAIGALRARARPGKGAEMAAYHKAPRPYLGVANPDIDELTRQWRGELPLDRRIALADALWKENIHETRIAAAKLLTQARIRPDEDVWRAVASWAPEFDAWAVADHACIAGQKRLLANPARLNEVETWTESPRFWVRRAALVITLPWARIKRPGPDETAARDRILGWASLYVDDPEWFIQKAVAWWVRDCSKRDPMRARAFLDAYGERLKPFARREAGRYLPPPRDP